MAEDSNVKEIQIENAIEKKTKMQDMQIYMQRRDAAIKDMNYVHEREKMNTIMPKKLDSKTLQEGAMSAKTDKEIEAAHKKAEFDEFKTHLFLGIHGGITHTSVADNTHILPTANLKVGFQNFFSALSKQLGVRVYADLFVASNIFLGLENNPLVDFIDTTFIASNANIQAVYEVNISRHLRFGLGAGFGIGYMSYHDEYWDRLNGFASNIGVITYFSINNRHKIEFGYKVFFYAYGDYITRKLTDIVDKPYNILSSDFAKPMSLSAGWVYVF